MKIHTWCFPALNVFSECEPCDQSCKGPHTKSWTVIADGNLARVLMGGS